MSRHILALTATVWFAAAAQLSGATVYTPQAFSSELGTIDTGTVAGTAIGSFEIPDGGFAPNVAFDTDGTLYAMVNWLADSADNAHAHLATIDMNSGAVTQVGSGLDTNMVALEIDARGTIYGAGFHFPDVVPDAGLGLYGDTMLYRLDKTTGQPTVIGDTGITRMMDMSFRSDGTLFATVANNLYTINPDTGASSLEAPITGLPEAAEIMGIMFDEQDVLYATAFIENSPLFTIDTSTGVATAVGNPGFMNPHGGDIMLPPPPLQAGDANQDLRFNQVDLIEVLKTAKYLTGEPATWGEGDWNAAPAGRPGDPPVGDGVFDQQDILAAQQNGLYLSGRYAVVNTGGQANDGQTSLGYDARTGEVWVDAPSGIELTSVNIDSATGLFTGNASQNLGGSFDNDADTNIFKATFGGSFGSLSFGNVAQAGLSEAFIAGDLTVVGSLAGGGDLGNVDLIYVPEPASILLAALSVAAILLFGRNPLMKVRPVT